MAVATKERVTCAGEVNAAELREALKSLAHVVEARTVIPVLSCVLLTMSRGEWLLQVTDLDVAMAVRIATVKTKRAGVAAINFKLLRQALGKLTGAVALSASGNQVTLVHGGVSVNLGTLPAENFPVAPDPSTLVTTVESGNLASALRMTRGCCTTEDTRYFLQGVQVAIDHGQLRVVATDGHRLALYQANTTGEGQATWLLPRKALTPIIGLGADGNPIAIHDAKDHLKFSSGSTSVTIRKIDANFPNYERVIPKGNSSRATVNRRALLDAIGRVSIVSNPRSGAVKFAFAKKSLTLSASDSGRGAATESVMASAKGAPTTMVLNHAYVTDLLCVSDADEFAIEFKDELSQIVLRPVGDDRYMAVLMPMRI